MRGILSGISTYRDVHEVTPNRLGLKRIVPALRPVMVRVSRERNVDGNRAVNTPPPTVVKSMDDG